MSLSSWAQFSWTFPVDRGLLFKFSSGLSSFNQNLVTYFHWSISLKRFNASVVDAQPCVHLLLVIEVLSDDGGLLSKSIHILLLFDNIFLPLLHSLDPAFETSVDMVNYSGVLDEVVGPFIDVSALHGTPHLVITHCGRLHKRLMQNVREGEHLCRLRNIVCLILLNFLLSRILYSSVRTEHNL